MNLISVRNIDKQKIFDVFDLANEYLSISTLNTKIEMVNKIAGLLFFEPSTRTRVGFETASWKLGMKTIFLGEAKPSKSTDWSESVPDTIRTMSAFVDSFFIRHPDNDVFREVLPYTDHPVINCGNGYEEHPTQALIDAYSIWKRFDTLDGLKITFIGDVKYSRAAHSLILLLSKFANIDVNLITPKSLSLQSGYHDPSLHISILTKDNLGNEDVLYSSGFSPITPSGTFSQSTIKKYAISLADIKKISKDCLIMNPLPRIDEIDISVDSTRNAYYFKQNELGHFVRMAIVKIFCDI